MRDPDLNAPRFKYKHKITLDTELINRFKEAYPKYSQYDDKVLINAIKEHNKLIWDKVINYRDGIEFPASLGFLFGGMVPAFKRKVFNWKKSREAGMPMYCKNWETDNKVGKLFYSNYKCRFDGRQLWYFHGVRQFTRAFSKGLAKNWRMYINMSNLKTCWEIFVKKDFRDKTRSRHREELKTYNEFDLE